MIKRSANEKPPWTKAQLMRIRAPGCLAGSLITTGSQPQSDPHRGRPTSQKWKSLSRSKREKNPHLIQSWTVAENNPERMKEDSTSSSLQGGVRPSGKDTLFPFISKLFQLFCILKCGLWRWFDVSVIKRRLTRFLVWKFWDTEERTAENRLRCCLSPSAQNKRSRPTACAAVWWLLVKRPLEWDPHIFTFLMVVKLVLCCQEELCHLTSPPGRLSCCFNPCSFSTFNLQQHLWRWNICPLTLLV